MSNVDGTNTVEGAHLQQYPGNEGRVPQRLFHIQKIQGSIYGVPSAPPPPLRVKDIIFSPSYARGQTQPMHSFPYKGNQVRHQMYDPTSGTIFFQDYSVKGGQLDGY